MSFQQVFDKFVLTKVQVNLITDMAQSDDKLMGLIIKLEESNDDYGIQDMYMNKILNYVEEKRKNGLH
jgi:hypothetical protein